MTMHPKDARFDRKECEHLIGAVAAELADPVSDATLPIEWCAGWEAAVKEHAEPLAEQLRMALAEIDRLGRLVTATRKVGESAIGGLQERFDIVREALRTRTAELDAITVARNQDRTEWVATYEAMRTELDALRCGDLGPYFDDELSAERHAAFDLHLTTCERCAAGLPVLMQQDAVVSQGFARRAAVVDAAVAWVRRGGTLAALTAAVNTLEDG